MKNLQQSIIISVVFLLTSFASAFAVTDSSDLLAANLKKVENFKSEFHQTVVDEKGELIEEYSGELSVKRPGKLYWKANQPFSQTLVSDGKKLWFYDVDLKQVTVRDAEAAMTQTPALILSGNIEALKKNFKIRHESVSKKQEVFALTPIKKNSLFETLHITFQNGKFAQLKIIDSLKQLTTINFYKLKTNVSMSDKQFTFKAPKGVNVTYDNKK